MVTSEALEVIRFRCFNFHLSTLLLLVFLSFLFFADSLAKKVALRGKKMREKRVSGEGASRRARQATVLVEWPGGRVFPRHPVQGVRTKSRKR